MMRATVIAVLSGAGLLLAPSTTYAYCRTTTCAQTNPPPECQPRAGNCECETRGKPLYWGDSCVSFSVQKDGSSNGITANELERAVRQSFDNWQNITCDGGGTPNIAVETFPQVECSEVRYNSRAKNQNLWTFVDSNWSHPDPTHTMIALTSVVFDKDSGEIYDVDVELNTDWFPDLTLETAAAGTDLLSVIQHESGHFLGLAHSGDEVSTMYCSYAGNGKMRTLETDDAEGLCAVYPPTSNRDSSCDPTPRHGFSTKCAESIDEGCAIAPTKQRSSGRVALLTVLGALLAWRRRRS